MATLINVSNRLPVTIGQTIEKSSGGLVSALEGLAEKAFTMKWIGWPGSDIADPNRRQEVERILVTDYGCLPVFMTADEVARFYEGFSNSSLWPLLHYMPTRFQYEPIWWDSYRAINQRFADKVLSIAKEGDLVWVHDYQLMLLPALLKEAMPTLKVGFFLHTPFPSYEVFRCHPQRSNLLSGLLGADQIGFHTFGYLRHFKSAVLRLLGLASDMMRIRHGGRTTYLGIYPIGINAQRFEAELNSPQYAQQLQETKAAHQGKHVVLSVERLDYTKGLVHRLEAIDQFLSKSQHHNRVKFVFISVPSREGIEEYQDLIQEIQTHIGRLNGRYATLHDSPIRFIHGTVSFTELCALYSIADVALVTPLIDGMNLVAKEYVACQRDNPGALVLSEFAGAAEELFSAIIVNPYDVNAVADSIEHALAMSPAERSARMEPMRGRVLMWDAQNWARSFIHDLASRSEPSPAGQDIAAARTRLATAISSGQRVAFFLDYDGTLREIEREPAAAKPHADVHALLERLRQCRNVDVTIISGRTSDDLDAWLGSYPFGLIAEHGASLRRPGHQNWERLDQNVSYAWKQDLLKILRLYEASTPGSFVEEKRTSLVWHYRRADPEFGQWKAKSLVEELTTVTANEPVHIRHGRKIVEISSIQVSKGAAVRRELEESHYDLILVAGDDQTDESMFELELPNLISIKVGDGNTLAQFTLPSPAAFRRFLRDVTRC
ncbi:MAG: bifunctional alpha,alpha-trehalose-phosphate synthase (UDP-forming)/trehalose-phosphatase [Bacillota bacterium]